MSPRLNPTDLLTRLRNLFLQGIALLAPLVLTIALIVWLARSVELVVGAVLKQVLPPDWYVPGLGLAVGVVLTLALGLLANLFLVRWLVNLMERVLDRIPLVKSLFQGLKDVSRFFAQSGDRQLGRPVSVALPLGDAEVRLVGFVMQERARLPGDGHDDDGGRPMAVYLPMSYQVGGYTLYLDPARVTPLHVGTEQALRAVLTGGALTDGQAAGSDANADADAAPDAGQQPAPHAATPRS